MTEETQKPSSQLQLNLLRDPETGALRLPAHIEAELKILVETHGEK